MNDDKLGEDCLNCGHPCGDHDEKECMGGEDEPCRCTEPWPESEAETDIPNPIPPWRVPPVF